MHTPASPRVSLLSPPHLGAIPRGGRHSVQWRRYIRYHSYFDKILHLELPVHLKRKVTDVGKMKKRTGGLVPDVKAVPVNGSQTHLKEFLQFERGFLFFSTTEVSKNNKKSFISVM